MGIFQKINNLLAKKQKIEKEIALLQKSCVHRKKSVKSVRKNVDSTIMVVRWTCDTCSSILGIPNNDELTNYLKQ